MRKYNFFFLIIAFGLGIVFVNSIFIKKEKSIHNKFLVSMKSNNNACQAYFELYPLVMNKDSEAMKLVSDAYSMGFGVPIDLIKSNIWLERSEYRQLNTGIKEFNQYQEFLSKKNFGMASIFLQQAAEKGNMQAISLLKDKKYIEENNLEINKNWAMYWDEFNYEELYPFKKEIEKYNLNIQKCSTL